MIVDLNQAVEILKSGGVVAFPTETVYGLGAIATNPKAVNKIYVIKNRPRDNPLICHFHSIEQIRRYLPNLPKIADKILRHFSPGPISLLLQLPAGSKLQPATAGLSSVIVRIPDQEITLELLRQLNEPLVGPSANTSGKFSGTNPEMITADLANKIDGVLDGGQTEIGLESTILDCRDESRLTILRQGVIGKPELEKFLKKENSTLDIATNLEKTEQTVPGNKYRHYSPQTPIKLTHSINQLPQNERVALLSDSSTLSQLPNSQLIKIDLGKGLADIAKNFYWGLYQLDMAEVDCGYILLNTLDNSSLAESIKDKIIKAIGTV